MTAAVTLLAAIPAVADPSQQPSASPDIPFPAIILTAREEIVSERKVPCFLQASGPGIGSGKTNSGVVRFHGASSQVYQKKSFGITLDSPMQLFGLRQSPHWVLNAAYIDRSLMRHKLSYDLFLSLSRESAPRFAAASRFVELQLNGEYRGAYLLMERIDNSLLGLRAFRSNETAHACIYKAIDHSANFGGTGHAGYEQRAPDPLVREYWKPLDEFNRFVSSAPDEKFFNPENGIESRLDLDNAIDFHLLVLVASNMDGITKNFLLARDAPQPGSNPRFFFVPWDYDATFGRNWDGTPVPPEAWLSNHLFDRLLGNAAYRKRFVQRWEKLRVAQFSVGAIRAMIDANVRALGEAAARNARRWPTGRGNYPDRLSFAEDIAQMKTWVEARVQWLDQRIRQP